ncbi:hypothetical protein TrVFT333_000375 [Trichoderma virens FT-333]|nr:hypothetical protein TrVFT333_000375 [Trichoderma virens FT-333]
MTAEVEAQVGDTAATNDLIRGFVRMMIGLLNLLNLPLYHLCHFHLLHHLLTLQDSHSQSPSPSPSPSSPGSISPGVDSWYGTSSTVWRPQDGWVPPPPNVVAHLMNMNQFPAGSVPQPPQPPQPPQHNNQYGRGNGGYRGRGRGGYGRGGYRGQY